jgi:hypothetical protein
MEVDEKFLYVMEVLYKDLLSGTEGNHASALKVVEILFRTRLEPTTSRTHVNLCTVTEIVSYKKCQIVDKWI